MKHLKSLLLSGALATLLLSSVNVMPILNNAKAEEVIDPIYLVLGRYGLYNNEKGVKIPELFLENAIAYTPVKDELPNEETITSSVEGSTFLNWMSIVDGNIMVYKNAPKPGSILYAVYSEGKGPKPVDPPTPVPPSVTGEVWNIVGNVNGWNKDSNDYPFTTADGSTYKATISLQANDEFKVIKDHNWTTQLDARKVDKSTSDVSNFDLTSDTTNFNIKVLVAGTYNLSFNTKGNKLLTIKKA